MLLLLALLIPLVIAGFIARAVYKKQVKRNYKTPGLTAAIVFILAAGIFFFGIYLLIINNIRFER
jgi:hypothetical protein